MTYMGTPATLLPSQAEAHRSPASPRPCVSFEALDIHLDTVAATQWVHMRPTGRPNFSMPLLRDIGAMHQAMRDSFADGLRPFQFYTMASRVPGIFNLGGDLGHFAERIQAGDRASLRRYGEACIQVVHDNAIACDLPIITVALVQGDALGGGFECALAFDVIVAERRAKFGLPEIIFNLFPGMGAYSFLSRRVGTVAAEKLIASGRLYTAEELHALGVVDVLAEDGEGEMAVRQHIAQMRRKHNAHLAIFKARRRANPVTYAELSDILDIWVEAALSLPETDIRKMQRLAAAQDRRMQNLAAPAYGIAAE